MENFNELILKRIKLRPWLILGLVFLGIIILILFASITLMTNDKNEAIVILVSIFLVALGFIPWGYLEHLENKMRYTISGEIQARLFNILKKDNLQLDVIIEIKTLQGISYSLNIFTHSIDTDYLEKIVKDIIEDMYKQTPYQLRINPSIGKRLSI